MTGLTNATIATAVWQDATAGDFTTANSIGKSLYNSFTANTSVFTVAALANAPTGGSAPTVGQIATAVWQDATAGDFTVSGSIGKSLFTSGVVPGGSGGLFIAGSNAATTVNITGNLSGSVGSVTGLTTATIATAVAGFNIGNGRTAAYFWQGGMNKVETTDTTMVVFATDDVTELFTADTTAGDETIASITPT